MGDGASSGLRVVRLVAIREQALDVGEVLASLVDSAAGGLSLFVGAVRDHDEHKDVRALEYSAHPTALQHMRAVAEKVAQEYDVLAVAAVHRTGRLEVGDAAVVVATAAGHRGEAIEATRALIDDLKATVPIWKHQMYRDGSESWVGTP